MDLATLPSHKFLYWLLSLCYLSPWNWNNPQLIFLSVWLVFSIQHSLWNLLLRASNFHVQFFPIGLGHIYKSTKGFWIMRFLGWYLLISSAILPYNLYLLETFSFFLPTIFPHSSLTLRNPSPRSRDNII